MSVLLTSRRAPVSLFGTLLHETRRAYLFACEDQMPGVWIAKSIADWDGEMMTMPRWLARKQKWVLEPPEDDHEAWAIIMTAGTKPVFEASLITVVKR